MINNPLNNTSNAGNGAAIGYGMGGSSSQPTSYISSPLASPRLLPNPTPGAIGLLANEPPATHAPFDQCVQRLREFLTEAPRIMSQQPDKPLAQYTMENGEIISCVRWGGQHFISGTDIVRILLFRFQRANRPVMNSKKFEEGIFSDLRMLKPGSGAVLEEPRSEFLEFLFKHNCIRTQKKQKVFHWYSVAHDQLYWDAMERELKRENSLHNINLFMLNEKRQREMLYAAAAQQSSMATPFMSLGYGAPNTMMASAPYPGAFLPGLPNGGANHGDNPLPPSSIMMASTTQLNPQIPPPPGPQPNGGGQPSAPSLAAQQLSASFGVNPNAVFDGNTALMGNHDANGGNSMDIPPLSPHDHSIATGKVESVEGTGLNPSTIDSFFKETSANQEPIGDNLDDPFMANSGLNSETSFADTSSLLMGSDGPSDLASLMLKED